MLCARWIENPYYQHFGGEEHFQQTAPFDRWSMTTRWRHRMGAERLEVLLQESLVIAVKTEAVDVTDLSKIIVDTTRRRNLRSAGRRWLQLRKTDRLVEGDFLRLLAGGSIGQASGRQPRHGPQLDGKVVLHTRLTTTSCPHSGT